MMGPEIPDPLREEFDKLERDVAARELRKRQARCLHEHTATVRQIGDRIHWRLCHDCGALLKNDDSSLPGHT